MGTLDSAVMCSMCRALGPSKASSVAHMHLRILFQDEPDGKRGLQSLYQCSVCRTCWLQQFDKWESCLGFKLWPGNAEDYLGAIYDSSQVKTMPSK